jgi:hypothetical protein
MDPHEPVDFKAQAPPGYVTQSPDTAYWAERLMFERLAAMSAAETIAGIRGFHRSAYRIQLSGLARQYPDATPAELELRAAEIRLGREVVQRIIAAEAQTGPDGGVAPGAG